jgi:hypothetical protein
MRLRKVARAALVIASSFASTAARAGGWWSSIDLNGRHIGIGETVNARAKVLFRTLQVARDARTTEYYAYLIGRDVHQRLGSGWDIARFKAFVSTPAEADAEESADAVAALHKRLSSLDTSRAPSTPWVPYVAWLVTAVVIAAALRRRRSDPVTEYRAAPEQVPDDTRELVSR